MPPIPDPPGFAEWEATVPVSFTRDPIWRTPAYRFGLWLAELVKADAALLRADRNYWNDADQLVRAVEGISANLSEGYGCTTGPDRARYYGYALRTARESKDWYFKARQILGTIWWSDATRCSSGSFGFSRRSFPVNATIRREGAVAGHRRNHRRRVRCCQPLAASSCS